MKKRIISLVLVIAMVISICQVLPAKAEAEKRVVPPEEYDAEGICANLPSKFDLRDYGYVTPVKYQMPYGLCWCFAVCASLESSALMKGYGEYDLSERHMGWFSSHLISLGSEVDNEGFDYTKRTDRKWYNVGGLSCGVINTIMKGYGIALEEKYPYEKTEEAIPAGCAYDCVLRCKRCMTIPTSETEEIKKAIVKYGALYAVVAVMAWETRRNWNTISNAVYVTDIQYDLVEGNYNSHAVSIVGWDDNFSRNNFLTKPPGDGAWIVKNTLGTEWGNEGYFYLSYYDASIAREPYWVAFEAAPISLYDRLYQYDGGVGQSISEDTYGVAIHFTAKNDETLSGVAIKPQGLANATVNVYKNVSDIDEVDNAKSIYTQEYTIDGHDYQTIVFDEGVFLDVGDEVYITVTFDKRIDYSIDVEEVFWANINSAKAHEDETYVKKLKNSKWKDLAIDKTPANACIKALTKIGHRLFADDEQYLGLINFSIDTDCSDYNVLKWYGGCRADYYDIYRKATGEKAYHVITTVPSAADMYYDRDVVCGKRYSYMIVARAGNKEGTSLTKSVVVVNQTPLVRICKLVRRFVQSHIKSKNFLSSIFVLLWCII